ncbi:hypothetical protein BpHYR1_028073 [Brachionus plicatilis]|uniref:Uncharacterized protein n=1 Tax=Brachionus plicatilis TaxID=10195 RepID=A0A3M7R2W7_BRAPC|nr:hypothetical protein BpHYR1_028073 [Brachionus plicatilis]
MQIRHSENEFYAVSGLHNDIQKPQSKNKNSNFKKIICIAGSCLGALVLIAIIVVIILFATKLNAQYFFDFQLRPKLLIANLNKKNI